MAIRPTVKFDDPRLVATNAWHDVEKSISRAMDQVARGLKDDGRSMILAAQLGQRNANAWRSIRYPVGRDSYNASAFAWTRGPNIIDAFNAGVPIRSKEGFFLAIPTEAAGKTGLGVSGKREKINPGAWERRTGQRLRFVYRRGAPSLLVIDNAKLGKSGVARANVGRTKAGDPYARLRGRATVVVFILVPQVFLGKRLDLDALANKWAGQVESLITQNWIG